MNNQPSGESSYYRYVMRMRRFPQWLTITYEVLGEDDGDECERLDDEIRDVIKENEKFYFETEKQKVMQSIKEMKLEMADFSRECEERRKKELIALAETAESKLEAMMMSRGNIEKKKEMLRDIQKIRRAIESKITSDDIERAREYPIERMIEIRNGMAKCLWHDDSRPSMNCRKNFVYCHACGQHGDAIDVFMQMNGCGFSEAVKNMIIQ